jgi:endonuclease YncB( thermonuclease family)
MMTYVSVLTLLAFLLVGHVHDGDTWTDITGQRWRLWGVDALELDQQCNGRPCGEMARDALERLISDHTVDCESRGKSYDRIVGQCKVDDVDLSREMVRQGWAFDEPNFSHGLYSYDETIARDRRRGMWSLSGVIRPSEWRRIHK